MGTTSDFDLTQTLFLFNWMANASSHSEGEDQKLADYTYYALTGVNPNPKEIDRTKLVGLLSEQGEQANLIGGDWVLKWGPGVYSLPVKNIFEKLLPQRADNTAYIVYSPSQQTYVVAIAGTDPKSLLDWAIEDFEVGPHDCVDWETFIAKPFPRTRSKPEGEAASPLGPNGKPEKAQISLGTAIGIWALLSQLTQTQAALAYDKSDETLYDYLTNLSLKSEERIIFTGHSLGGALSPTLAYWYRSWAKANGKPYESVYAMPTAGPTPGNETYQAGWDTVFSEVAVSNLSQPINSGNEVSHLNCNVWNSKDVVPHGWKHIFNEYAGAKGVQDYYFFDIPDQKDQIGSLLGTLKQVDIHVPETSVSMRDVIVSRQTKGDEAHMGMSDHTKPIPCPDTLEFINEKDEVETYQVPKATGESGEATYTLPYTGLLDAIGKIHVWGYGGAAFGIDISVFLKVHAKDA